MGAGRRLRDRPAGSEFRFIDLFAGIGGLRLAFERAGGRCVFTSEWDSWAQKTYRANFGPEEIAGDIRSVRSDDVPEHDVLVAGFPCQPFSIAGVSKKNALGRPHGFECETQGTLFFEIARLLRDRRPRAFVLENVKNLRSHDQGRTFRTIMRTLQSELDYNVEARVLNARGVVPQARERVFLVGFRGEDENCFSFDDLVLPDPGKGPKLEEILHPEDGSEPAEPPYTEGPLAEVSRRYVLSPKLWTYLRGYAEKHRQQGNGFGYGLVGAGDVARTLSARYYKDGSEILIRRGKHGTATPRRLTPRECARLMGFPDSFVIPVSDTRAYKQFGNSVVVPLAARVASGVARVLGGPAPKNTQRRLPFGEISRLWPGESI